MKKIVHLTTVHPRSDVRILLKEAATLAGLEDCDVSLVVADGLGDGASGAITIFDAGRAGGGRFGRFALGSIRAYRTLSALRPDIVHFHDPELIPAAFLLRLSGAKIVYDVHEDLPRQIMSKHWIRPFLRRPVAGLAHALEGFAARRFQAIVAATKPIAARFPEAKTITVQNFPLLTEFLPVAEEPYASRACDIAYIGGIAPIRGSLQMIEAMEILGSRRKDVRLQMAGPFVPPRHEDQLRQKAGWPSVQHHGVLDRKGVASLLGATRAGLVVLHPTPNYIDALPVKMFEYMAAGLPVIASHFPLWREIVEGAQCGLTVDPMKPVEIADAMAWIFDNPQEAEAMGRRGRKAVADIYNWDAEAAKLVALYRRLFTA